MAEAVDHHFVSLMQQASAGGLSRLRGHGAPTIPAWRVYPAGARFNAFVEQPVSLVNDDAYGNARAVCRASSPERTIQRERRPHTPPTR